MLRAETGTRERTSPRHIAKLCFMALYMAAASRAAIAGGASPFTIACFTAGLYAGLDFKPLLAGCVIGFMWENISLSAAATFIGCLIALGVWALVGRISRAGTKLLSNANEAVLAAGTALIPAFAAGYIASYDIASSIACALIAQALAPVLYCASNVGLSRTALLSEERLALCAMAVIALFGASKIPLDFPAEALAGAITLLASYSGASYGAAAGAVAGLALALGSGAGGLTASLGVAGLIAGLTLPLGRGWSALAFGMVNLIGVLYSKYLNVAALSPVSCIIAGLIYSLVNENAVERLSGWIAPIKSVPDAGRLAASLRLDTRNRVAALQKAFETLADGYGDFRSGEDEKSMTVKLRKALCEGCPGYEGCWCGNADRAGRLLCSLLAGALKGEPIRETDDMPPETARVCRRSAIIPRKLAPILRGFYEDKKRETASRAGAATVARHFSSAERILSGMVESLDGALSIDDELCRAAEAALERAGIEGARVLVLSGERIEVAATRDEMWLEHEAREARLALSQALNVPLRAAFSRTGDVTLRLLQAPRLAANVGYASRPLTENAPCGDSYVACALSNGRVLLALSDGMGTGARAAGESARTVELIRRFLLADINDGVALDAINQLLLLRGGDEMYATADICVLDLNEGGARFIKQGACASYIVGKSGVAVVEGGRLPLGIIDEVRPTAKRLAVAPGDIIVMLTDGVCECASDEDDKWIKQTLTALSGESADAICRGLIKSARERNTANPDDMTAIAVSVAETGVGNARGAAP